MVPFTRCAVVRERGLSSGSVGLASGGYLGLECCRLLALGLGWLEALPWRPPTLPTQFSRSAFGFGNLVPFESSLRWGALFWICGPRLLNVATGGVWDPFVLLPKILGCWGFFARAFLLGRLVILLVKCYATLSFAV